MLLLHVPAGHDVDPQALGPLQVRLAREYGAALQLVTRSTSPRDLPPMLLGRWPRPPGEIVRDLTPQIERVFFTLDWLDNVI